MRGNAGQSVRFHVESAGVLDIGKVIVPKGEKANSMVGKILEWESLPVLYETRSEEDFGRHPPAVLLYCTPDEASMAIESMSRGKRICDELRVQCVVVVEGAYPVSTPDILVLQGKRPVPATTYLVAPDHTVILETFGLPPLYSLRRLGRAPLP